MPSPEHTAGAAVDRSLVALQRSLNNKVAATVTRALLGAQE